jgi:hypothetical protein
MDVAARSARVISALAEYEKHVEEAKPSMEKSLKKYDLAIIGVWTAETAAEAKKIVEGLI